MRALLEQVLSPEDLRMLRRGVFGVAAGLLGAICLEAICYLVGLAVVNLAGVNSVFAWLFPLTLSAWVATAYLLDKVDLTAIEVKITAARDKQNGGGTPPPGSGVWPRQRPGEASVDYHWRLSCAAAAMRAAERLGRPLPSAPQPRWRRR